MKIANEVSKNKRTRQRVYIYTYMYPFYARIPRTDTTVEHSVLCDCYLMYAHVYNCICDIHTSRLPLYGPLVLTTTL